MKNSSAAAEQLPTDEPVLWKERLWPSFGVWVAVIGLGLVPAVIFAPINKTVGVLAAGVVLIILIILMLVSTPTILVTRSALQVGRARIERQYVGRVEAFTKEKATQQRGPALHGWTYLCIRGWIDAVVKIEIIDEEDRTPYWLTSSRHPYELAQLLAPGTSAP